MTSDIVMKSEYEKGCQIKIEISSELGVHEHIKVE